MTLINDPNVGILCPQSFPPVSREHAERVALLNRMYTAMNVDEETHEAPEQERRIYDAAKDSDDWMRLYVEDKAAFTGTRQIAVTTAYYRCQVCGFTLPTVAS